MTAGANSDSHQKLDLTNDVERNHSHNPRYNREEEREEEKQLKVSI